jgi:hypothetical protein
MHRVKSLPDYLRERYDHWKQSSFPKHSDWFASSPSKDSIRAPW